MLDVFDFYDVYLVRDDVIQREQSAEGVEKLGISHIAGALEQ